MVQFCTEVGQKADNILESKEPDCNTWVLETQEGGKFIQLSCQWDEFVESSKLEWGRTKHIDEDEFNFWHIDEFLKLPVEM
jgi:hypothetical protein